MPIFKDHSFRLGASAQGDDVYEIGNSIRFNRTSTTADHYMHRTPSGAGNRKKWTWSCWFKLGEVNGAVAGSSLYYTFLSVDVATNSSNRGRIVINNDSGISDNMNIMLSAHSTYFMVAQKKVNDPTAWYHLVIVWDTDNDLADNRQKMFINGERIIDFLDYNTPSDEQEIGINLASEHRLGAIKNISNGAAQFPFDGYMAEIFFLDGYAYDASYFGQFNSDGIWIPIDYNTETGDYGSNGFYLKGDNAATLGNSDVNSNHFTLVGITNHDQTTDTPNNNFAVLNTLDVYSTSPTNGNLKYAGSNGKVRATIPIPTSGKWYWEIRADASRFYGGLISLSNAFSTSLVITSNAGSGYYTLERQSTTNAFYNASTSSTSLGSQTLSSGDVMAFAYDSDTRKLWIGYDGGSGSVAWYSSGDPASGSNELATLADDQYSVFVYDNSSLYSTSFNFGQEGTFGGAETAGGNKDKNNIGNFFYAVPTGYLALCTRNLFTG